MAEREAMQVSRRGFLVSAGAALLAGVAGCSRREQRAQDSERSDRDGQAEAAAEPEWESVRQQFRLDPELIHLAGLLLASHPDPVRESIERHRQELDRDPATYVQRNFRRGEGEVRRAAAEYLDARSHDIALTDSTTMGLALVYNGVSIRGGQEFLTARFDYHSTHDSIRYKAGRTGATVREIPLYQDIHQVSEDEIVETISRNIRPETRVVTSTWVHSATGLKIPVRRIADELARRNADREPRERILLGVDGVHGLGVEDATMDDLGCDFFMAGTHKWLFGPRGSGIIWGNPRSQDEVGPTIPTFSRFEGWGPRMTPGGFKPFEHQWALAESFRFHQRLGKKRVQDRIHGLARQLKEGLAQIRHVTLYTPMSQSLSAGIVCFMVRGLGPRQVVSRLRDRKIVASTTPYSPTYARLTPGIYNTAAEMERTLRAIRELA